MGKPFHIAAALAAALLALSAAGSANPGRAVLRLPIEGGRDAAAPDGWTIREWKGRADIAVADTEIGKAIHLKSASTSTAIYRDIDFDISQYRYLNWKWKVASLPKGGDVRIKNTDDQAAQIYVIFPKWPVILNSRLVGYIWDTTAPAGMAIPSTKTNTTRYIVVESGAKEVGGWRQERRNVHDDYKRLFGEEPHNVGRVTLMIDSDDTRSRAEAFIGDIYFSKD
ncbi:MAG: DUF3047 domain-containing protein [Deltaproteobacteria bacterium]|nr:DUF3047 domain-containing protein [Deltaproteobacteria bacterium]